MHDLNSSCFVLASLFVLMLLLLLLLAMSPTKHK
jgi:hypothetical protein